MAAPSFVYHLTLREASLVTRCCYGSFSGDKRHELVLAKGSRLELLAVDDTGRVASLCSVSCSARSVTFSLLTGVWALTQVETFGRIRDVIPFRLMGASRDHLVCASDSGKVVILLFDAGKGAFERVHEETYGKTGLRRIVPGQWLAADPRGRAFMIGAVEKAKLVYILNRDAEKRLTISSPLEAHKSHTVVWDAVGLDVGYDNPTFAVLEADHSGEKTRVLTRYELDMGLNHIVRKSSHPVNPLAHKLCTVPGGSDGPGGVLVCAPGQVSWTSTPSDDRAPVREVTVAFPAHANSAGESMVVAWAAHRHKNKFFFLLQVEEGDVFKLTLAWEPGPKGVTRASLLYFDTIAPSGGLCVLRNGFLFAGAAASESKLYQFAAMGDEHNDVASHSDGGPALLVPRAGGALRNLVLREKLGGLAPVTSSVCADVRTQGQGAPQLWVGAGAGESGSLVELRRGLPVTVLASQALPGVAEVVWTLTRPAPASPATMLVLAFANATLTLGVNAQGGVAEMPESESQILAGMPSLHVAMLGSQGDVVQATPHVLRHVRGGGRVNIWNPPAKQRLVHATSSGAQVLVALSGGEIVYFELDPQAGVLLEMERLDCGAAGVASLALGPCEHGARAKWAAYCDAEARLRVVSLHPQRLLQRAALQQLSAPAHSLAFVVLRRALYLCAGTRAGLLLRSQLDPVSGALADTRSRFLGLRPVRLAVVRLADGDGLLALGERAWLTFASGAAGLTTAPLSCPPLQWASSFTSAADAFGWTALQGGVLTVLSVKPSAEPFHVRALPLRATPRRIVLHVSTGLLVVAASPPAPITAVEPVSLGPFEGHVAPGPDGVAAASLHLADPFGEQGEGCVALSVALRGGDVTCMASAAFPGRGEMLVVGMRTAAGRGRLSLLSVARTAQGAATAVLEQTTEVAEVPTAVAGYQGLLLCGLGRVVRLYDLGRKQFLKKCEHKDFPRQIVSLVVLGTRFVAGDSQESVQWCFYEAAKNAIRLFADEVAPRYVTAVAALDYNTVAAGDKFGTLSLLRLSDEVNEALRLDAGGAALWQPSLNGAPWKCDEIARLRLSSLVTSLHCAALLGPAAGSDACVLYTTVAGGVGALVPVVSREEVDFFTKLEAHMRVAAPPLLGNSHMRSRSSAQGPVLRAMDGDLCEMYAALPAAQQRSIAADLGREVPDVLRKLEDVRKTVL